MSNNVKGGQSHPGCFLLPFGPVRNEQLGLCLLIIRLVWFSLFVFWSCASQPPLPSRRNELKVICFFQAVTQAFQNAETKQTKTGPKQLFFVPSLICQLYCFGLGGKQKGLPSHSTPVIKNWWVASIHGSNIKLNTADDVTWFLSHKRPSLSRGLLLFAQLCVFKTVCVQKLFDDTDVLCS